MSSEELETTTSELEPDQTQTIPNTVTLTLDIRERDIIAHCTSKNIPFQTASLEVGDMLLKSPTETLVFERKTLADLEASIKDGRYRDGFQVLHTSGVADTVWHLSQIQERMAIPDKTAFDPSNGEYASAVKSKTKKCENLTPEMTYLMQLAQIPGLSMTIAQDISKVYPCFSALLKAIGENGAKAFDAIAGMGKMRSKKMLEYIR